MDDKRIGMEHWEAKLKEWEQRYDDALWAKRLERERARYAAKTRAKVLMLFGALCLLALCSVLVLR